MNLHEAQVLRYGELAMEWLAEAISGVCSCDEMAMLQKIVNRMDDDDYNSKLGDRELAVLRLFKTEIDQYE